MAMAMLEGTINEGDLVTVDAEKGQLTFHTDKLEAASCGG
jgi:hypothetical protein